MFVAVHSLSNIQPRSWQSAKNRLSQHRKVSSAINSRCAMSHPNQLMTRRSLSGMRRFAAGFCGIERPVCRGKPSVEFVGCSASIECRIYRKNGAFLRGFSVVSKVYFRARFHALRLLQQCAKMNRARLAAAESGFPHSPAFSLICPHLPSDLRLAADLGCAGVVGFGDDSLWREVARCGGVLE